MKILEGHGGHCVATRLELSNKKHVVGPVGWGVEEPLGWSIKYFTCIRGWVDGCSIAQGSEGVIALLWTGQPACNDAQTGAELWSKKWCNFYELSMQRVACDCFSMN